jgi:hypothetical protein
MSDQEKMEAILASDQVSKYILAKLFYRLMYDDLSSIGDAISEGKVILYDGSPAKNAGFVDDATCYTIKQPTIMFNGCEINAPIAWEDVKGNEEVFIADPLSSILYSMRCFSRSYFDIGLVFKTKDDSEAYRKAAGWVK